ncbi:MAG: putative selenate reductase subunit YgfK [Candidatus Caldatribacteriota bacterium]
MSKVFNQYCALPLGPAAGPHTQLAQNIISAYLVGARFIELKTVQKLDHLTIDKPCIDARDEGYNTEWSTELSLTQAYEEYAKAWIILHFMEEAFGFGMKLKPSFIFNMSIGYDLSGIQSPGMESFIHNLTDSSHNQEFNRYLEELESWLQKEDWQDIISSQEKIESLKGISRTISPHIVHSATLSTMHGCPPDEIEAIGKYILKEKKLSTYIKLNPTLLGLDKVRNLLDELGFNYITLKESSFKNDLQWEEAKSILTNLAESAQECNLHLGIKLSNTLATVNHGEVLPGEEMYLSGRILFPLTINLAYHLAREFQGKLPISYAGGASQINIQQIYATGISPITLVTDLLKPGGYLRMGEMARRLEESRIEQGDNEGIDLTKLQRLSQKAREEEYYRKEWKGDKSCKVDKELPFMDCYIAPCVFSCPIQQDIPEYIFYGGKGEYNTALQLIYLKNPLPHITGYICEQKCADNCTRLDYDQAINIREVKRIVAEQAESKLPIRESKPFEPLKAQVAIIGAGPAGLSVAYFLAQAGFKVTIWDRSESPGGVVRWVLPNFRIPEEAIEKDISIIQKMGVNFQSGKLEEISLDKLKEQGFKYIFIGIGAEISQKLSLSGDNKKIYAALDFLSSFNQGGTDIYLGKRVAIVGGGNTAIDCARAALRYKGVEKVYVLYRRTEKEMPAHPEEFKLTLQEGVIFYSLLAPESFWSNGILKCRQMILGEVDQSGRRRPVPTDEVKEIEVDSIISAIGEKPNISLLRQKGININQKNHLEVNPETLETNLNNVFIGGDLYRGPSSVVQAIADARKVAETIIQRETSLKKSIEVKDISLHLDKKNLIAEIYQKKGRIVVGKSGKEENLFIQQEAERCLNCRFLCNKCVDICPNRANVAIEVNKENIFQDFYQILHLDALCNECGNCATFCPYQGKPYRDKLTLFVNREDFQNSNNNGFFIESKENNYLITLRLRGKNLKLSYNKKGEVSTFNHQGLKGINNQEEQKIIFLISSILKNYPYLLYSGL